MVLCVLLSADVDVDATNLTYLSSNVSSSSSIAAAAASIAAMTRSSILNTYWNPEQPPPSTDSLRTRFSFFDVFCSCFILYLKTCISGLEHRNLIEGLHRSAFYLRAWFSNHKSLIQVRNGWQGAPETVLEQSAAHFDSNSFPSVLSAPLFTSIKYSGQ